MAVKNRLLTHSCGPRSEMLKKERHLVESNPGPKNKEKRQVRGERSSSFKHMNTQVPDYQWLDVAAQINGLDAADVVSPHYMALKPVFRQHVQGPFSLKIDQFAFVLRVDGCMGTWDLPLLSHIDLNKRNRCISIDVHVPGHVWKAGHVPLAEHIAGAFTEGMVQMINRATDAKIEVRDAYLKAGLKAALADYKKWAARA